MKCFWLRLFFLFCVLSPAFVRADLVFETKRSPFKEIPSFPTSISSINFVSGTPLNGAGDDSGGFGDVAANVFSALEMKKRNPELKVRLLVTSLRERFSREMLTSNEILKIMIPVLDPTQVNQIQTYKGVEFIFLEADAMDLARRGKATEAQLKDIRAKLLQNVPAADVSVQFSSNSGPMIEVLRANSKLVLTSYEPHHETGSFKNTDRLHTHSLPDVVMIGGVNGVGYYLEQEEKGDNFSNSLSVDKENVSKWLESISEKRLSSEEKIAFAYSKEKIASEVYLNAMIEVAQRNPREKYRLIVKKFPGLNLTKVPPNLIVTMSPSFGHEIFHSLIRLSSVSPLVTRDTTLSLAISATNEQKSFVYEAPPWKKEAADQLHQRLTSAIKIPSGKLNPMFLIFERPDLYFGNAMNLAASSLADFLVSTEMNREVGKTIANLKVEIDTLANLEKIIEFYRRFQKAWYHGFIRQEFANDVMQILKNSKNWTEIADQSYSKLKNSSLKIEKRFSAALLFLKAKSQLGPAEKEEVAEVFAEAKEAGFEREHFDVLAAMTEDRNVVEVLDLANSSQKVKTRFFLNQIIHILKDAFPQFEDSLKKVREQSANHRSEKILCRKLVSH